MSAGQECNGICLSAAAEDTCSGWEDEEYDCTPDSPCTSCWHSGRYDRKGAGR